MEDDTIEFPEEPAADPRQVAPRRGLRAFLAAGAVASAVACTARYRRRRASRSGNTTSRHG